MLVVIDKVTHEEHLSEPLQTNKKKFKIAITFLTGDNAIFKVTSSNNKIRSAKSLTDEDGFIQITISPGTYEIETSKNEIGRNIIEESHFTDLDYPFTKKPNFSTLGSIIEKFWQQPIFSFKPTDNIRNLLKFNASTKNVEWNLSPKVIEIYLSIKYFSNEISLKDWFLEKNKVE